MAFREYTLPGTMSDIVNYLDLAPGVLTHATASLITGLHNPRDTWAILYVARDLPTVDIPYIVLAAGNISDGSPLSWIGELTINPGMQLAVNQMGYNQGRLRISHSRSTETNIKEIGRYVRAIFKQTP